MTDLPTPAYSQLLDVSDPNYKRRACGAAALAMVLGSYELPHTPTVDEILEKGLTMNAYSEGNGWLHRELAAVGRTYGAFAHPEDWSGDPAPYAWEHLVDAVTRGPVVASVAPAFSPSEASHLIVVHEMNAKTAIVFDPFRETREEVRYEVPLDFLKQHWTQRIICVHRPLK